MSDPTPDRVLPSSSPDWEAVARYLAGEGSDEESERMRTWLSANPEDQKVIEALDRMVESVPVESPVGLDVEAALRKTRAAAHGVLPMRRPRSAPWWQSTGLRVAAGLGIVALGLWLVRSGAKTPVVAASKTFTAPVGQPDTVNLPDGSKTILSPGSQLAVAGDYGTAAREVRLSGQAWFSVVHDDARPFVVRAGSAEVRDVGTQFEVSERRDSISVAVHEGAVLVRGAEGAPDGGVLLHQGDAALVAYGVVSSTRGTVTPESASWVSGQLRFRNVELAEIATELRRWYGVQLRVDGELARRKVDIDVNASSVSGVAQEIAIAVGGKVSRRGDTVVVERR